MSEDPPPPQNSRTLRPRKGRSSENQILKPGTSRVQLFEQSSQDKQQASQKDQTCHSKRKTFTCQICSQIFTKMTLLQYHFKVTHSKRHKASQSTREEKIMNASPQLSPPTLTIEEDSIISPETNIIDTIMSSQSSPLSPRSTSPSSLASSSLTPLPLGQNIQILEHIDELISDFSSDIESEKQECLAGYYSEKAKKIRNGGIQTSDMCNSLIKDVLDTVGEEQKDDFSKKNGEKTFNSQEEVEEYVLEQTDIDEDDEDDVNDEDSEVESVGDDIDKSRHNLFIAAKNAKIAIIFLHQFDDVLSFVTA